VEGSTNKEKRPIQKPDLSMLKEQQLEAFESVMDFLDSRGGGYYLIEGYAGVGKTYLISRIIEAYLSEMMGSVKVGLTAPTNKAVRELYQSSEFHSPSMDYSTIHSMLGLKEHKLPDGSIAFKP